MNKDKMEQLAMNLSWRCNLDQEQGKDCCPCLPQHSCPIDMGKTCPATYEDWLEWMESDDPELEIE